MLSGGALIAVCKDCPYHPGLLWSLFIWHDAFLPTVSLRAIRKYSIHEVLKQKSTRPHFQPTVDGL